MSNRPVPDRPVPGAVSSHRAVQWTLFLGATAAVVYVCLLILGPFLNVLAWSSVFAISFHPIHHYLVRKTGRVSLSALISSVLVVVTILIPLLLVTGLAISQLSALKDYVQETFKGGFDLSTITPVRRAYDWIAPRLGVEPPVVSAWVTEHLSNLVGLVAQNSLTMAVGVTGVVTSSIFTVFAMFLLFRDGDRIVAVIARLLPFERTRRDAMLLRIRDVIYASVYGVVVIAMIQGALCGSIFWVLGIPSAALWGTVTVVTSVLPIVGAAAVWVPGVIYLLIIGHWPQAIGLAVTGTFVISGVDNFLRPRLVGDRVGLSELVMFFALLGGLQVFGLLGIIVGPVFFAVAASILDVLSDEPATAAGVAEAEGPTEV
ncbi:MAG: AI-2E family transporter [Vicinamibacterales bacterium]